MSDRALRHVRHGRIVELALEVETLASQCVTVLAFGTSHILPDNEMARVLTRFKTYGQTGQG